MKSISIRFKRSLSCILVTVLLSGLLVTTGILNASAATVIDSQEKDRIFKLLPLGQPTTGVRWPSYGSPSAENSYDPCFVDDDADFIVYGQKITNPISQELCFKNKQYANGSKYAGVEFYIKVPAALSGKDLKVNLSYFTAAVTLDAGLATGNIEKVKIPYESFKAESNFNEVSGETLTSFNTVNMQFISFSFAGASNTNVCYVSDVFGYGSAADGYADPVLADKQIDLFSAPIEFRGEWGAEKTAAIDKTTFAPFHAKKFTAKKVDFSANLYQTNTITTPDNACVDASGYDGLAFKIKVDADHTSKRGGFRMVVIDPKNKTSMNAYEAVFTLPAADESAEIRIPYADFKAINSDDAGSDTPVITPVEAVRGLCAVAWHLGDGEGDISAIISDVYGYGKTPDVSETATTTEETTTTEAETTTTTEETTTTESETTATATVKTTTTEAKTTTIAEITTTATAATTTTTTTVGATTTTAATTTTTITTTATITEATTTTKAQDTTTGPADTTTVTTADEEQTTDGEPDSSGNQTSTTDSGVKDPAGNESDDNPNTGSAIPASLTLVLLSAGAILVFRKKRI